MMAASGDDFQELHDLLFGAKERYRSVRATVLHTVDGSVAEESRRRFVDWRVEQPGGSGLGILRTKEERRSHGPDVPQDFYLQYEDSENTYHLWHERPDRWREEVRSLEGRMLRCLVFGGARGPRWVYEPPETAIHDPAGTLEWPHQDPPTDLSFMLDPSEELFYYALLDDATVHKTGRRTTVAGREAVEVRVETISWGYPPSIFHGFWAPEGTTDHLLLIKVRSCWCSLAPRNSRRSGPVLVVWCCSSRATRPQCCGSAYSPAHCSSLWLYLRHSAMAP